MKRARDTEALREVIDASPLSQRALARAAMCSRNLPSRLVAGKPTSDETAARIARALGYPPPQLFEDAVSSEEQQITSREAVA